MIKEKSCGAVVYKIANNELYFLVEYMSMGHISLPKGHVEENETEDQTALREIKEETNLDVRIDTNFKETITYSPREGTIKDVIFFAAEVIGDNTPLDLHDNEVTKSVFLKFNDAYQLLTHNSDKDVLKKANEYLRGQLYE